MLATYLIQQETKVPQSCRVIASPGPPHDSHASLGSARLLEGIADTLAKIDPPPTASTKRHFWKPVGIAAQYLPTCSVLKGLRSMRLGNTLGKQRRGRPSGNLQIAGPGALLISASEREVVD